MRILFDATNIINQPTGAGVYTYNILRELSNININDRHEINIFVNKKSKS